MTLTPREYLHQYFGPLDRRWIESLSEERCWELMAEVCTPLDWCVANERVEQIPDATGIPFMVPGEYPNWR